jgi:signal transduction histidine kinase
LTVRGWGFGTKITALVVAASVMPCLVLWILSYWALTQSYKDAYGNLLESLAQQSSRQVQIWLEEQSGTATAIARSPDLIDQWTQRKRNNPRSDEHFLNLYRLHQIITLCNSSSRWFTEVRLADPDGIVFMSDNTAAIQDDIVPIEGKVDRNAVLAGRTAYSNLFLSKDPGLSRIDSKQFTRDFPTMFVVTPVRGEGETVGMLSCRLAVADLGTLFAKEANSIPLDVFLLDKAGNFIASNRHGEVDKLAQAKPTGDEGQRFPRPGLNLKGYPNYEQHKVVAAWQPVFGTDLHVLVQCEQSLLLAPIRNALRLSTLTAVALCIASAMLGLLVARRLLDPLHQLTHAAEALAEGHRDLRVNLKRGDEIGKLGDTFDRMSSNLETTLLALEAARDEALSAYRAKGRFLANMTHELRTPLNAIIGYSEMLLGEVEDAQQTQWLEDLQVIRRAGKDLLTMINGILDLSKLEAGKMNLDLEDFPISDLFEELRLLLAPLLRDQSNELIVATHAADGETVHLDRMKTKQILLNLLSNANKFTKKGQLRLIAEVTPSNITLSVSDTGIGMTEEQCKRVFEEFAQADDSTTRKYGGTGLGLTIVRRFTELMGGTVSVSSIPKEGTTFRVALPRRVQSAAAA